MLCTVGAHELVHLLSQVFLILRQFHINEIYHYNAPNIPQPELSRNLCCGFKVGFKSILLLVVSYTFVPAVYIYYMQGFCMLNDEVSAAWQIHRFSKRGFY